MNKINYQIELDTVIEKITAEGKRPSLLLHSCCGPCSSYVLDYLKDYFDITVFYYNPNIYPEEEYLHRLSEQERLINIMNGIYPPHNTEYEATKEQGNSNTHSEIKLLTIDYDHAEFLDCVKGLESEPEGGARCTRCFELRLQKTMELAEKMQMNWFGTTLTVSPHKNAILINEIGRAIECEEFDSASLEHVIYDNCPDHIIVSTDTDYMEPAKASNSNNKMIATKVIWLPSDFKKREGYKRSIELSKEYDLYRQEFCGCEFAR